MLYAAIRSMGRKKEKTINLTELEPKEKLKYEIAEELGLLDRVMQDGWKSLTSKETGRNGEKLFCVRIRRVFWKVITLVA